MRSWSLPRLVSVLTLTLAVGAGCKAGGDDARAAPPEPTADKAPGPRPAPRDAGRTLGPKIDHDVKLLDGSAMKLSELRGHALLIVNTASECGYTPQYEGLQTLYERYRERGLEVLAFPCNDFGGQEPGDAKTIRDYLSKTYQVTFPVFEKQRITKSGPGPKSPLWKTLTEDLAGDLAGEVKWNFTKFLVNREGFVVARFASSVDPLATEVVSAVEGALGK